MADLNRIRESWREALRIMTTPEGKLMIAGEILAELGTDLRDAGFRAEGAALKDLGDKFFRDGDSVPIFPED